MSKNPSAPTEAGIVTNRKWKLILIMLKIFNYGIALLFAAVTFLLIKDHIKPEVWSSFVTTLVSTWAGANVLIGGWYMSANVVQKKFTIGKRLGGAG